MKMKIPLSLEEKDILARILQPLEDEAKFPISLEYLMNRWMCFAKKVDEEYEDSIYDYRNDLGIRDIIEQILEMVPITLNKKIVRDIRRWDRLYKKATRPINRPLTLPVQGKEWWWFRIPNNPGKEFDDDLRSSGIEKPD